MYTVHTGIIYLIACVFRYLFTIDMIGVSQPDQTLEISLHIFVGRIYLDVFLIVLVVRSSAPIVSKNFPSLGQDYTTITSMPVFTFNGLGYVWLCSEVYQMAQKKS